MLLKRINYDFKIIKSAKISVKLTIVYAVMFSLLLLILNASILYGVKYYLYSQANKQIEDVKTTLLNRIPPQNVASKEIVSDVQTKENISINIVQKNGKLISSSERSDHKIKIEEPFDKIGTFEEEGHIYKNLRAETKDYGTVYIQIVKDMDNEYGFMEILFAIMAIADFIGIIVSTISGYIISKKMLRPIDKIIKAADNISINNLKERIEVTGPDDELKRLGNTFNNMIDRLQGAFDRQNQFVSDASHELRTPIAVIQGYANLLDRWGKDDREALERSIYAIKLETNNMAKLVENLLFIAKGGSENQRIEKKEFWLNELIYDVIRESKLIDHTHIIFSEKNDVVSILADPKMIKQMLRVFIDNSIKFTPEQGKIDISSEIHNKTVKVTITDSGIGIPKDEIQDIFERFYTVDKSRSKEKGGSGLGLSIAKLIVDIHKGSINVESQEGIGTKIIVILNT